MKRRKIVKRFIAYSIAVMLLLSNSDFLQIAYAEEVVEENVEEEEIEDQEEIIEEDQEEVSYQVLVSPLSEGALPEGTDVVVTQVPVMDEEGKVISAVSAMSSDDIFYQSMKSDDVLVLDMGDSIDTDIQLSTTEINEITENINDEENSTIVVPLNISLSCNGEEIQPSDTVEVSIQIPEGIAKDSISVYHVPESGEPEKMDGQVIDDHYVFTTNHFSVYTLIGLTASDITTSATLLTSADRGKTLTGGKVYYIDKNTSINEITVSDNALVVSGTSPTSPAILYIPYGTTLTVTGKKGGSGSGKAAIYLPENETLYIRGGGTLVAKGGDASPANYYSGSKGRDAHMYIGWNYDAWHYGPGGRSGSGGAGAGAGIGTNGAAGGARVDSWFNSLFYDSVPVDGAHQISGRNGTNGLAGENSESAGTLYVLDVVTINAVGGSGSLGGTKYKAGSNEDDKGSGFKNSYFAGGGGAGGAGGGGGSAAGIGSGGAGGGSGGTGGDGACTMNTGSYGNVSSYPSGEGGKGGKGYTNGENGGGTRYLTGSYGGAGGAAGTSGAGGKLYVATTATCSNSGGSGINGKIATMSRNSNYNTRNSYYTITLNANAPSTSNVPITQVSAPTNIVLQMGIEPAANGSYGATAKGWTFLGWYTAPIGGVKIIDGKGYFVSDTGYTNENGVWVADREVTLYAQWTPGIYQIYLSNQGADTETQGTTSICSKYGSGWYSNISATGSTLTKITIPKKRGYTFLGYYTEVGNGGSKVVDGSGEIVGNYNDIIKEATWYARWEATPYTATFNLTLDGAPYSNATVALYQYGSLRYILENKGNGSYINSTVITGEYNVHINGRDTGRILVIDAADNSKNLSFKEYKINTNLDGVASKMDVVTLKKEGIVQYTANYSGGNHRVAVLQSDITAENTFDIYVGSENVGQQITLASPAVIVNYYNATVELTYDSLWKDAKVTLWQNGVIKHTLTYDATKDSTKTTTYKKPILENDKNNVYDVVINGNETGLAITTSEYGFEAGNHIAKDTYYKVTATINKDNVVWEGTRVYLNYSGTQKYSLPYSSTTKKYSFDYVRMNDGDAAYNIMVEGSSSDTDTGITVNKASSTKTVDYYTISYYNVVDNVEQLYFTQIVQKGLKAKKPTNPRKTGMSFSGWHEKQGDSIGNTAFSFDTTINKSTNLYAVYATPKATINGYVRCNNVGVMTGTGSYYRMMNFQLSGYPVSEKGMLSIVLTVENGSVSVLGSLPSGATIHNNIDSSGNGNYTILFEKGISPTELEKIVRDNLLIKVVNGNSNHTMQIKVYGTM